MSRLKVLVACEFSGAVRDRAAQLGHAATSCDLLSCETVGSHYRGDVRDLLTRSWDIIIAFPPCTYLTRAGAQYWHLWGDEQAAAAAFVRLLSEAAPLTAIENPPGALTRLWRPADQYVCPSWWGAPYSKKTGLWLRGLPPLVRPGPAQVDQPAPAPAPFSVAFPHSGAGHARQGASWKRRVRTPAGLAEAMCAAWLL